MSKFQDKKNDIQMILKDIEAYNASKADNKTRRRFYKNKILELGGIEQKHFTPLHHRLKLSIKKEQKRKQARKLRKNLGNRMKKYKKKSN